MDVRIEPFFGKGVDDTGANGIRMVCCSITPGEWAKNQTVVTAEKGFWGEWSGQLMCQNDTFVMNMDARVVPNSAADDVAMGGAAFVCNSIEKDKR